MPIIVSSPQVAPPNQDLEPTQVFIKDLGSLVITVQALQTLQPTETLTSVSLTSISPITDVALVTAAPSVDTDGKFFTFVARDGENGITYSTIFKCTTSLLRTLYFPTAILVQQDQNSPYVTKNPYAFQSLLSTIEAGDAAIGTAFFVLDDPTIDATMGYVTWEMLDNNGNVYSSGNAYDYQLTPGTVSTTIQANAVVNVPSTVPPTLAEQRYQIRWMLVLPSGNNPVMHENIEVLGALSVPMGTQKQVELQGDTATLAIVVPTLYQYMSVEVYKGNTRIVESVQVTNRRRVAGGWYYEAAFETAAYCASLDPYNVVWKYKNPTDLSYQRQSGMLFLINPTMMEAIEDVQSCVMKARATIQMTADTFFDPATVMTWLRRGRDTFNGAAGYITEFTMTNASGSIREFWLRYSEVAMLQAQYLAEGEKSFNFSGQEISLDVDHAPFYESMASTLLNQLDQAVPTFKKNLQIKGVTGGDGNMAGVSAGMPGAMGAIGVGINPVSPRYGWGGRLF